MKRQVGLKDNDAETFLRRQGLLGQNESAKEIQVNFRRLAEGKKCDKDERELKVTLADGTVKTLCYNFSVSKKFANIILTAAEKQEAANKQNQQPKKAKQPKKGGK